MQLQLMHCSGELALLVGSGVLSVNLLLGRVFVPQLGKLQSFEVTLEVWKRQQLEGVG
jgi:hypothetical protein